MFLYNRKTSINKKLFYKGINKKLETYILTNKLVLLGGIYMFFVFNRKKISSYLISLGTVIILFAASLIVTNNSNNTVETVTKIESNQKNNVITTNKEVASSINSNENVENINCNTY